MDGGSIGIWWLGGQTEPVAAVRAGSRVSHAPSRPRRRHRRLLRAGVAPGARRPGSGRLLHVPKSGHHVAPRLQPAGARWARCAGHAVPRCILLRLLQAPCSDPARPAAAGVLEEGTGGGQATSSPNLSASFLPACSATRRSWRQTASSLCRPTTKRLPRWCRQTAPGWAASSPTTRCWRARPWLCWMGCPQRRTAAGGAARTAQPARCGSGAPSPGAAPLPTAPACSSWSTSSVSGAGGRLCREPACLPACLHGGTAIRTLISKILAQLLSLQ